MSWRPLLLPLLRYLSQKKLETSYKKANSVKDKLETRMRGGGEQREGEGEVSERCNKKERQVEAEDGTN
jgi:hypothetical protein